MKKSAHIIQTEIDRPDGSIVTRTYDARGRLKTRTDAGIMTTYDHDGAGRLSQVTHADGSWQSFSYDTAGLLQGITNNRAETTTITRDTSGAETARKTYNAANVLSQAASRQINAVGHVAALLDANNYATKLLYAADGRLAGSTDPVNISRSVQLDVLSRPSSVTVPNTAAMHSAGGPASVSVSHTDDTQANHKSTTDTAVVPTTYGHNSFNQRSSEASNDAGNTAATVNAAGVPTSFTNAASAASPSRRWTTGCCRVPTRRRCNASAMAWRTRRSIGCCASGWRDCRIRSIAVTVPPATATRPPFCKPSSH